MSSCVITGHLVAALRGQEELRLADHSTYLREGIVEVQKWSILQSEESLADTLAGGAVQGAGHLQQATKTGACLMVQPSTVQETELGAQEWQDALFLRYGLDTIDPPKYSDGCNANFSKCHALD